MQLDMLLPHPAGKMYIQDKVEEYADEVFDLLVGSHISAKTLSCVGTCHCSTPAELDLRNLCSCHLTLVVAFSACPTLLCMCCRTTARTSSSAGSRA